MNKFRNIKQTNFSSANFNRASLRGIASSKVLKIIGVFVIAVVAFSVLRGNGSNSDVKSAKDIRDIGEPRAQEQLNREFKFPIKDSESVQLGEVSYVITDVEIRDEIIIQGERYGAINGRTIVIVSLKLTNEFDQPVKINSKNYIRLATDPTEEQTEWLAPDYTNDPVEVQAISTKPTRLGFTIDESAQRLQLQVGEIKGEKEIIELSIRP